MAKKKKLLSIGFGVSLVCCILFSISLVFLPVSGRDLVAWAYPKPDRVIEVDFSLPEPALYPVFKGEEEPVLTATAAAVLDRDSGVFLLEKNPHKRLLPASTVKIMTALVVLDHYSLNSVLLVSQVKDEGQTMELKENEMITVEGLLYGLLVSSANDAARVLASNYPGGQEEFVKKMNLKAQELGMKDTYFANSNGLEGEADRVLPGADSYTCAWDLAIMADYALRNETFAKMVATKQLVVKDPLGIHYHPLYNLNELLWKRPEVFGVKTGWTEDARECLVTYAMVKEKKLITVVLGSEDRFGESEQLINWVENNFSWEKVTPATVPI